MKLHIILIGLLILPLQAIAQERLEPEDNIFTDSFFRWATPEQVFAVSVFHEAFSDDVIARVYVTGSLGRPDEAIGLHRAAGNKYAINTWRMREGLAGYYERHPADGGTIKIDPEGKLELSGAKLQFPQAPKDMPLDRCTLPIDDALAGTVISDWRRMLMEVRQGYPRRLGADGAIYHFSMQERAISMAGQIWSPQSDTRPGMLLDLASAMRDACNHKAALSEVRDKADRLNAQLNALEQPPPGR